MPEILVEARSVQPLARQPTEYVERKGVGHPDSICDAVMESVSVALSGAYVEAAGHVPHHNVDKGLLVAGQTTPQLGGGVVNAPMRLVVGDRATNRYADQDIPVREIVETTVHQWMREHLRFVDPTTHIILQNELRPGSAELVGIFDRPQVVANDTSAGVGFAPLTECEHLVLATEHLLNSAAFKRQFPETGEDVKVMGVRRGRHLHLTVALAFLDRYFWDQQTYFHRKLEIQREAQRFLESKLHEIDELEIQINTLDQPQGGLEGMYLTVLGTSAENGDGGQVGRGNRVNGLISLCRPLSLEAAAGKNPVSHVGKIYNLLSQQIAGNIYHSLDAVEEVYVWLCSQIGGPLDQPWFASAQLSLADGAALADVRDEVTRIVHNELADVQAFTQRLVRGELSVC